MKHLKQSRKKMKTSVQISMMTAVSAVLLFTAGCQQETDAPARDHVLSARIADDPGLTRTSFGNYDGKFRWDEGDEIIVPYADRVATYGIKPDTDPVTGTVLASTVGSNFREFYAVYPVSAWVAPTSASPSLRVKLEASYDVSALVATGNTDYAPVPMVAVNDPSENTLDFHHVGGLLRLTCKDVAPETKRVVITFDKDVTGTYTVHTDDPAAPYIESGNTGENNAVTFIVAASDAGVGAGVTSLVLNMPVPCGTYARFQVEAYDGSGNRLFSRSHDEPELTFTRAHGKRLMVEEVTVGFRVEGTFPTEVTLPYTGGIRDIALGFTSYKTDGTAQIPESFHMEYSETGQDGTWTTESPDWITIGSGVDFRGSVDGQDISIAVAPRENAVRMNRNGEVIDDDQEEFARKWHFNAPKGTPDAPFDLSTLNVATGNPVPEGRFSTANCYVVQAPGYYKFPAVYGNAIKNGSVYEDAFHAKINDNYIDQDYNAYAGRFLGWFKDHNDNDIHHAWIDEQLAGATLSAKLLWTDAKGLIKASSVQYNNRYISFEVQEEDICQGNVLLAIMDGDKVAWSWHIWVTDADLTEHNIGGTTKSSYSDHSPDKPEPEDFDKPETFHFAKVNLGWCDAKTTEIYPEQDQYIRFVQDNPDGTVSGTIHLHMTAGPTSSIHGNAPYYQCGRKDPLVTWNGNTHSSDIKAHYPPKSENDHYPRLGVNALPNATIGMSIQHPSYFYYGNNGWTNPLVNGWNPQWNALPASNAYTIPLTTPGSTDPVFHVTDRYDPYSALTGIKSIYDPSPVGYRIPFYNYYYYESFSENDGIVTCVDAAGQPQTFPLLGLVNSSGYSEIHGQCNYYCTYVSDYMESGTKYIIGSHLTVWKDNSRENWHHGAGMSQAFSIRPQVDASQQ